MTPEELGDAWDHGKVVVRLQCSKCRRRIGEVRVGPAGLALGMNRLEPNLPVREGDKIKAPEDIHDIFDLSADRPMTRTTCRCGHNWHDFPYDVVRAGIKARHRVIHL